uniref:Secreted protein n=1 Tax=Mesocestoides corti TaxID=53468 RepID=A0A5K3EW07_MESCO
MISLALGVISLLHFQVTICCPLVMQQIELLLQCPLYVLVDSSFACQLRLAGVPSANGDILRESQPRQPFQWP